MKETVNSEGGSRTLSLTFHQKPLSWRERKRERERQRDRGKIITNPFCPPPTVLEPERIYQTKLSEKNKTLS